MADDPPLLRVLYAEDNADDADLTRTHFGINAPDVRIDVVRTGSTCLSMLAQGAYDALLMDYRLPDMDGIDVLKALAAGERHLPVVVTTAAGDEAVAVQVLRLGAWDYVPKQGNYVERLPAILRSAVHEHSHSRSRSEDLGTRRCRVLYVEHDAADIDLTVERLAAVFPRYVVETTSSAAEALSHVRGGGIHLVLADLRMPEMSALDLLRELRREALHVPVIVITGGGDETTAAAALRLGAYDYIVKREGYLTHLPYVIENAITRHQLTRANERLHRELLERKRLQETTTESLALLNTLQQHAPIGIAFMDRECRFQRVNDELAAINGIPAAAHIGRTVEELLPELWPHLEPWYRRVLAGDTAETDVALRTPDQPDGARHFITHLYPVRHEHGDVIGIGVAVAEITERKRAELALQEHAAALAEGARQKDEFLAMLGHELRNPLAAIRMSADVMRRAATPDPVVQNAVAVMDRQIRHTVRLLDDLLDVARITTGRIRLKKGSVDLRQVVHEALDSAKEVIEARRHSVDVAIASEPVIIDGDLTRLVQVVVNLVTNAAKFTDQGGRIQVQASRENHEGVVRVTDSGIGISARLLPKVFDLFTQDDRTLDRAEGGLGLGLSLVRRIIELHGGTVQARSEGRGRGSEFTIRVPLAASPQQASARGASRPGVSAAALKCLVVEDNVDAARMLGLALELEGHQVQLAYDGREAVDAAAAFRPEAVVLDIGLPRMNGYEAARAIRQQPGMANVFIVAVTGYGQPLDYEKSRDAGIGEHLVKPIALDELLRVIAARGSSATDVSPR
jgi:PAS domain S-box-containing protein